ncbi:MAG: hypothetical protein H0W02_24435 [Ktedonobacteraceae bacterium]|nr:hypothetical protein [Ktedonobacteraceae bacterium]
MLRKLLVCVVSVLMLVAVLAGMAGVGAAFARGRTQSVTSAPASLSTGAMPATAPMVAMHTVDMRAVPVETAKVLSQRPVLMPRLTGTTPAVYAQRKAAAARSASAPVGSHAYQLPARKSGSNTPAAQTRFQGMANSAATCPYFGGCQPPDQALATSPTWVLQGVNTSFAVYNTRGTLQSGWPKNARRFFGVPNPGTCDANGPFLSDPRAFYDPNDQRFWVADLQIEGAFGLNSCPFKTIYWVAVSRTSNPNGAWNIYAFDMSLGRTNAADYTQFGFDGQAVYFTGNMFNQDGSAYMYAEIFGAKKSTMEAGRGVTAYGFYNLTVGGVPVDTVQPMETEAHSYSGPVAGLFSNSFNMNFGGGSCSSGCSGVTVWAMGNPGTSSTFLTGVVIGTNGYSLPPNADEPGCGGCIETLDTRISGTPVYHDGLISFALETAVNNGSQIVPGIYWGQVAPVLDGTGHLTGGSVYQSGYYYYGSDNAASFGALMPDGDGNLFMIFEFMGGSFNPGVAYTARRVTFTPGLFHDGGIYLRAGDAPTFNSRWGDYEATSYDNPYNDDVWFSGQYSTSRGDWSTYIGKDKFTLSTP